MIFKMQCEIGVAIYSLHAYYKSLYVIFRINAQKKKDNHKQIWNSSHAFQPDSMLF